MQKIIIVEEHYDNAVLSSSLTRGSIIGATFLGMKRVLLRKGDQFDWYDAYECSKSGGGSIQEAVKLSLGIGYENHTLFNSPSELYGWLAE